jgi:hypothetical protein
LSVAKVNPLRYRGYYYDAETEMYTFFGFLTSLLLGGFVDELGTRDKAEYYAYNWYYFVLLLANKRKN